MLPIDPGLFQTDLFLSDVGIWLEITGKPIRKDHQLLSWRKVDFQIAGDLDLACQADAVVDLSLGKMLPFRGRHCPGPAPHPGQALAAPALSPARAVYTVAMLMQKLQQIGSRRAQDGFSPVLKADFDYPFGCHLHCLHLP
jgi:hypothetical protein